MKEFIAKPALWAAAVVMALMIGGITFVMMYLGDGRTDPNAPKAAEQGLTFGVKKYPQTDGEKALACELNQSGHHDFWFQNDSGREVPVGLVRKSCKCSQVELALLSESAKARVLASAAARVLQRAPRTLTDLPTWAATFQYDQVYPAAAVPEEGVVTTRLQQMENMVAVPNGAVGWVRLRFHGEEEKPRPLEAELWMFDRNGTNTVSLDLGVMVASPVLVNKEITVGEMNLTDLDKGKKEWIICYSVTRPKFRVRAARASSAFIPAEADPLEVGDPIPLSDTDLRRIEQTKSMHMLHVKSGYRIPVRLNAYSKDGTPFQLGHFRRLVKLTFDDDRLEPMEVDLVGVVFGNVVVGDGKDRGAIEFGTFRSSEGARGSITLHSDVKGLKLELDSKRLPKFLKVHFPPSPQKGPGGHSLWPLRVEVPKDAAHGSFPNLEDPDYRDCAIYVRTIEEGKKPRAIRIPVTGTANDD